MNEWNDWNGMFVLCAPGCLPSTVLCFLLTVSVFMPYVVTTWATWAVWGVISQDISAARRGRIAYLRMLGCFRWSELNMKPCDVAPQYEDIRPIKG